MERGQAVLGNPNGFMTSFRKVPPHPIPGVYSHLSQLTDYRNLFDG